MSTRGIAIGAAGVGAIFLWSALFNKTVTQTFQDLVRGQKPQAGPMMPGPNIQGGGGVITAGPHEQFASDFERYVGIAPYLWGGSDPHGWDCSGACNWVICHDSNHDIPGYVAGTFTGNTHGPDTLVWLAWLPGHAQRIPSQALVMGGDICIWQTHMGIAVNNQDYISAYDTQEGTVQKPIHGGGPIGEIATFWRLNGSQGGFPHK